MTKKVKHVEIPLRIWVAQDGDGSRIELGCLNQFRSSLTEKQHKTLYAHFERLLKENEKWVKE